MSKRKTPDAPFKPPCRTTKEVIDVDRSPATMEAVITRLDQLQASIEQLLDICLQEKLEEYSDQSDTSKEL